MSGIDLLIEEHKYVIRMLGVIRKACLNFMDNKDDVFKSLQYIFNYVEKENSINKRDVDVIIKTFKYIFIDEKIENFMEICRILLIFFNQIFSVLIINHIRYMNIFISTF